MIKLRKHPTLWGVKEDVVEVKTDILEGGVGGSKISLCGATTKDDEVSRLAERDVNLDIVVHEGDEGQRQSWVAVEPEAQWHEQSFGGDGGCLGDETDRVTNHDLVTDLLRGGLGELVVHVVPEPVVFVDGSTTDLHRDLVDQELTNVAGPSNSITCACDRELGEFNFEETFVDKVTVASNQ